MANAYLSSGPNNSFVADYGIPMSRAAIADSTTDTVMYDPRSASLDVLPHELGHLLIGPGHVNTQFDVISGTLSNPWAPEWQDNLMYGDDFDNMRTGNDLTEDQIVALIKRNEGECGCF